MEAKHYLQKGKSLFVRALLISLLTIPVSTNIFANPIRDSIVAASKVNVTCNGSATGSATLGVKGGTAPYTYIWSPSISTNASATGLSAGTYSAVVRDNNGVFGTMVSVTITQPAAIRDSMAAVAGVGCNGGNGG
ncbi:MAG TPA: SprB repeat-containing protein, partial [Bacteroidia bacterium]|nr:SprB repeat-containing protein [Bacteroidia bacterium]